MPQDDTRTPGHRPDPNTEPVKLTLPGSLTLPPAAWRAIASALVAGDRVLTDLGRELAADADRAGAQDAYRAADAAGETADRIHRALGVVAPVPA